MNNFFNKLSTKSALLVGLVGGVLTLGTIGFIILLTLTLRGDVNLTATTNLDRVATVNQPTPTITQPPTAQAPSGSVPPLTKADHIRGNKNAPLTWVEYSDFECPFCKRFHPAMLQMTKEYGEKIKWVYRHYPLSFHQNALKEAEASECANELGGNEAFWKYTDAILERTTSNGTGFSLDALVPLAQELGLNENKFKQCLDSGKYVQHITDEMNAGATAGVRGTPGSFLVDKDGKAQLISGALPYEQIKAAIEAQIR